MALVMVDGPTTPASCPLPSTAPLFLIVSSSGSTGGVLPAPSSLLPVVPALSPLPLAPAEGPAAPVAAVIIEVEAVAAAAAAGTDDVPVAEDASGLAVKPSVARLPEGVPGVPP